MPLLLRRRLLTSGTTTPLVPHKLTVQKTPVSFGVVPTARINDGKVWIGDNTGTTTADLVAGQQPVIHASDGTNAVFSRWEDGSVNKDRTIIMPDQNVTYRAVFEEKPTDPITITVKSRNSARGLVLVRRTAGNTPTIDAYLPENSIMVQKGTALELFAYPLDGSVFSRFNYLTQPGVSEPSNNEANLTTTRATLTANTDRTYTAWFNPDPSTPSSETPPETTKGFMIVAMLIDPNLVDNTWTPSLVVNYKGTAVTMLTTKNSKGNMFTYYNDTITLTPGETINCVFAASTANMRDSATGTGGVINSKAVSISRIDNTIYDNETDSRNFTLTANDNGMIICNISCNFSTS